MDDPFSPPRGQIATPPDCRTPTPPHARRSRLGLTGLTRLALAAGS